MMRIPPYTVLTVSFGERHFKKYDKDNGDYELCNTDAKRIRGKGGMINDGRPNALIFNTVVGKSPSLLILNYRTTYTNEEIRLHYGPHHRIKLGPYIELDREGIDLFCKETLPKLLQKWEKDDVIEIDVMAFDDNQFIYLCQTPAVLMRKLLENQLNPKQFTQLIGKIALFEEKKGFISTDALWIVRSHLLDIACKFQENLSLFKEESKKQQQCDAASQLFVSLTETYSVISAITTFSDILENKGIEFTQSEVKKRYMEMTKKYQYFFDLYDNSESSEKDVNDLFNELVDNLLKFKNYRRIALNLICYNRMSSYMKGKAVVEALSAMTLEDDLKDKQYRKMLRHGAAAIYSYYQFFAQYDRHGDRTKFLKAYKAVCAKMGLVMDAAKNSYVGNAITDFYWMQLMRHCENFYPDLYVALADPNIKSELDRIK